MSAAGGARDDGHLPELLGTSPRSQQLPWILRWRPHAWSRFWAKVVWTHPKEPDRHRVVIPKLTSRWRGWLDRLAVGVGSVSGRVGSVNAAVRDADRDLARGRLGGIERDPPGHHRTWAELWWLGDE
jgi:hypothetical protein